MTNTLHRQGSREGLQGDYVIFATSAAGYNKDGSGEKKKEFLRIALRHRPVNVGSVTEGNLQTRSAEEILDAITDDSGAAAVFADVDSLCAVIADLVSADLGISITVSGLLDEVQGCCGRHGFSRHSAEHSLGIRGRTELLPRRAVMELQTMCGHGMVSFNFIQKMIDWVKLGRATPVEAARYLARPCECGVFNPVRAEMLLEEARRLG